MNELVGLAHFGGCARKYTDREDFNSLHNFLRKAEIEGYS